MTNPDPVLDGVVPVNQPRLRTRKEEQRQKHQSPHTSTKSKQEPNDYMGLGTVDPEIIEKQLLLGKGAFHPSNITETPLAQLKEDVILLKKQMGKKPTVPTPFTILHDHTDNRGNTPTPFQFYKEAGGTSEYSSINNIDLTNSDTTIRFNSEDMEYREVEETDTRPISLDHTHSAAHATPKISISGFAHAIIRNIAERNIYYEDRVDAYVKYFSWLSKVLADSKELGEKYNREIKEYEYRKSLYDAALEVARNQQAYENSLTDVHRREIYRTEWEKESEETLQALIDKKVAEAIVAMSMPKKRGRPRGSKNKQNIEE